MKKLSLTLLVFVFSMPLFAQATQSYSQIVTDAEKAYYENNYLQSARTYNKAFAANNDKGRINHRYDAACSWALAGNSDSAFFQLIRIMNGGKYANCGKLLTDNDLASLHSDPRWQTVCNTVRANKEATESGLNQDLIRSLDSIYVDDQKYRKQLKSMKAKYGLNSTEIKEHWKLINRKDSINYTKVSRILDKHGWLGADSIGQQGNSTLFLVIQHSNPNQQEKYLPILEEAYKQGNARGSNLALLKDRIAIHKGEKQIYGSQIGQNKETGVYYVLPLLDPDNVDTRRASMGMGSIKEYVKHWRITWDVEEYNKNHPGYMERMNPKQ